VECFEAWREEVDECGRDLGHGVEWSYERVQDRQLTMTPEPKYLANLAIDDVVSDIESP
jgi:hypothetical protein